MRTKLFIAICAVAALFAATPGPAAVRHYCIAADEVVRDYVPSSPTSLMSGQPFSDDQRVLVEDDALIGHVYRKVWGEVLSREITGNGDRLYR
jgi:hypothetical protein